MVHIASRAPRTEAAFLHALVMFVAASYFEYWLEGAAVEPRILIPYAVGILLAAFTAYRLGHWFASAGALRHPFAGSVGIALATALAAAFGGAASLVILERMVNFPVMDISAGLADALEVTAVIGISFLWVCSPVLLVGLAGAAWLLLARHRKPAADTV